MEILFQFQLPLMLFFQNIETIFLDTTSEIITVFGESPIPLLITIFIYWCWDKKKGFVVVNSLMSAMMSMQILKAIFRIPRPFMKYPELIQGKRQQTATGFSFPSGHSTTASSFYGGLCYSFKQKWIRTLSIALIVLVPISRLYLGVHWPMDILVGTLIGLVSAFALGRVFEKLYRNEKAFMIYTILFALVTLLIALPLAIIMDVNTLNYATLAEFKATTLYRAIHNLMQNSAIAAGIFAGMALDRKTLKFVPAQSAKTRILSLVAGLLMLAVVAPLIAIPVAKYTFEFLTLAFVGIWVTYLFPLIATKLKLMEKEN